MKGLNKLPANRIVANSLIESGELNRLIRLSIEQKESESAKTLKTASNMADKLKHWLLIASRKLENAGHNHKG